MGAILRQDDSPALDRESLSLNSIPADEKAFSYPFDAADAMVASCEAALADPAVATNPVELTARHKAVEAAQEELARLYARWGELEAKNSGA